MVTLFMNMYKEKKRNLIVLISFAASFSIVLALCLHFGKNEKLDIVIAADFSSNEMVSTITENANTAFVAASMDYAEANETEVVNTTLVENKDAAAEPENVTYTVTTFEAPVTLYSSDTVNVRAGAGIDYAKVGKVAWGTAVSVTGVTDNGWYEVMFNDTTAFIRGDYLVAEVPGVPYLFVGDSRTVQMQQAIGNTDKAFIAKVGEGYSYFKNTVIPNISSYAGNGTVMIINFGVNDLANASKYISLVNSNIDSWTNAGITVYYSAVTPVGNCSTVTNAQIEAFNAALQEELDSRVRWIDSYSYLQQVGFSSSDGLHYSLDTYRNLYAYYNSVINQN